MSKPSRTTEDYEVGYGRPPKSTRFEKGRSGNRRGRPKGSRVLPPYEAVLGQMVLIREAGVEKRVTAAEAFLLHLTKSGLEGNSAAARSALNAIQEARARRAVVADVQYGIEFVLVKPGNVNGALTALGMAVKLDRFRRETARMALQPWIVGEALRRLGDAHLTREQQATVLKAVRTPHKVRWPDWWEVKPTRGDQQT